jgi:hypothetical protein
MEYKGKIRKSRRHSCNLFFQLSRAYHLRKSVAKGDAAGVTVVCFGSRSDFEECDVEARLLQETFRSQLTAVQLTALQNVRRVVDVFPVGYICQKTITVQSRTGGLEVASTSTSTVVLRKQLVSYFFCSEWDAHSVFLRFQPGEQGEAPSRTSIPRTTNSSLRTRRSYRGTTPEARSGENGAYQFQSGRC